MATYLYLKEWPDPLPRTNQIFGKAHWYFFKYYSNWYVYSWWVQTMDLYNFIITVLSVCRCCLKLGHLKVGIYCHSLPQEVAEFACSATWAICITLGFAAQALSHISREAKLSLLLACVSAFRLSASRTGLLITLWECGLTNVQKQVVCLFISSFPI